MTEEADADGGDRSIIGDLFLLGELGECIWPGGFGNCIYLEGVRWGGRKFLLHLSHPPPL